VGVRVAVAVGVEVDVGVGVAVAVGVGVGVSVGGGVGVGVSVGPGVNVGVGGGGTVGICGGSPSRRTVRKRSLMISRRAISGMWETMGRRKGVIIIWLWRTTTTTRSPGPPASFPGSQRSVIGSNSKPARLLQMVTP
jgi:hypothetical protein